ncbi:MAG: aminopeptidase P family protein [Planctomycetaceae bacterium]|nr:aminopeptidase P family protein [Planctomycetaceae bacterium]
MLTQEGCLARRRRLWNALPESVDWVLVADPRHVQYLAGFWVQPLSFSGGERGLLLLERSGRASLLADNFTVRSAVHTPFVDREVVDGWYDHKHSVINRDHSLLRALEKVAPELQGRTGLVESEWLPFAAAGVLKLDLAAATLHTIPTSGANGSAGISLGTLLRELRRRKEPDEMDLLRQCIRAGVAGQAALREIVRPGISELDVYVEIEKVVLLAAGRPGLVYGDFRATTPKNIKAGGLPTAHILQHGDLFILDYSVVLDGYRGDFTNTLAVGTPTDPQIMLYDLCKAGLEAGERTLKAGVLARDVHAAVFKPYDDAGYGHAFQHHAGHGIGLAHPEPPILVPQSEDVLVAGDVVTLEPGAYVEGIGGMRFEHNYLITETGAERLSSHDISLT